MKPFEKSCWSQSFLVRPFTPSARTVHRPGWRWAAHEGAGRSCWAPQGGGGRSPGESTLPLSLTWWGTEVPPFCTVPRVECIPRNKKANPRSDARKWKKKEGSTGSVPDHLFLPRGKSDTSYPGDPQYPEGIHRRPCGAQMRGWNANQALDSGQAWILFYLSPKYATLGKLFHFVRFSFIY